MMTRLFPFAILALASIATGCTTAPTAQVTRFHLDQPIAHGNIAVRPLMEQSENALEMQSYLAAVGGELGRLGFMVNPQQGAIEQIATVNVERRIQPSALPPRSPVSIGIGGGSFGNGVGIGIGTSFGIGRKKSNDTAVTLLEVQIKRASDASVVWEGRATSRTGSELSPGDEIGRLAAALFRDFPGPSGKTVEVK